MTDIKNIFSWIQEYQYKFLTDFDLMEKKKIQAKEVFVISTTILYWEVCLKRIQELVDGYQYSKGKGQKVNMALMERAALETFAVGAVQLISIEPLFKSEFKNKQKLREYEERTKKLLLGLRESKNKNEAITASNIRNHLEKIDKYLKSLKLDFLAAAYDDLSNMCHPNLSGMVGNYYVNVLKKVSSNGESKMVTYFEALLTVIKIFDEKAIQEYRKMVENDGEQFYE